MIPRSFLQDENGDISIARGLEFTPNLAAYVAQRLDENLSSFLGEWYLDSRLGLPYWRLIGQKPDLALLDAIYKRAIFKTPGVGSLLEFAPAFDSKARRASVRFRIKLKDGSTVTSEDTARPFVLDF